MYKYNIFRPTIFIPLLSPTKSNDIVRIRLIISTLFSTSSSLVNIYVYNFHELNCVLIIISSNSFQQPSTQHLTLYFLFFLLVTTISTPD